MEAFLSQHGGELLVGLVLLLIVGAILARTIRGRRTGGGGCCGGCGGCPHAGTCHAHREGNS